MTAEPWVLQLRGKQTPVMFKADQRLITFGPPASLGSFTTHASPYTGASASHIAWSHEDPATSAPGLQPGQVLYSTRLGKAFTAALEAEDMDLAYDLWSQEGERLLKAVAASQGRSLIPGASRGGPHSFHDQRRRPRSRNRLPLFTPGACGRQSAAAKKLLLLPTGHRRDRTWAGTRKILAHLTEDLQTSLRVLLQRPASEEAAAAACAWLTNYLDVKIAAGSSRAGRSRCGQMTGLVMVIFVTKQSRHQYELL